MVVHINKENSNKKTVMGFLFGRFISTSYGTELIPLFPYLRAGLLKGGSQFGPNNRSLITDYGLKGCLTSSP